METVNTSSNYTTCRLMALLESKIKGKWIWYSDRMRHKESKFYWDMSPFYKNVASFKPTWYYLNPNPHFKCFLNTKDFNVRFLLNPLCLMMVWAWVPLGKIFPINRIPHYNKLKTAALSYPADFKNIEWSAHALTWFYMVTFVPVLHITSMLWFVPT